MKLHRMHIIKKNMYFMIYEIYRVDQKFHQDTYRNLLWTSIYASFPQPYILNVNELWN